MSEVSSILSNQLLSTLPHSVYQRLLPHSEEISLHSGQILDLPGKSLKEVYFPTKAVISLMMILSDNSTIEVGMIGQEGMVGLSVILGGGYTTSRSVVQIAGTAIKFPSEVIQAEFNRGAELHRLLLLYAQAQLSQVAQIAVCQSHHIVEQRLARWLLLVSNCIGEDNIPATQKSISTLLGVRRASVTEAAITLQQAGLISYSRGRIVILNRQGLKSVACECYDRIIQEYNRLLRISQKLNN